jgi:carboxypeptidase T
MKKFLIIVVLIIVSQPCKASTNRNYSEVKQFLNSLAATYPNNVTLVDLGKTDSGESIKGVRIGSGITKNLLVAAHHGNEYGSTEIALATAEDFAKSPITGQSIYIIPVLNISGFNKRQRNESKSGVAHDPNRDYPGPCGTAGPFALKSTKALADFVRTNGIISSVTLHTFYPAVATPWGLSTRDVSTPYDSVFNELAVYATELSHYPTGSGTELIYPADGTFEDYAFWQEGIWSFLFELGYSHSPTQPEINEMISLNVPGIRKLFEKAPIARANDHAFRGACDASLMHLDRHDE